MKYEVIITLNFNKMIYYNVTVNINESVHDQWVKWMQEKHIADVIATGKFTSARLRLWDSKEKTTRKIMLFMKNKKECIKISPIRVGGIFGKN